MRTDNVSLHQFYFLNKEGEDYTRLVFSYANLAIKCDVRLTNEEITWIGGFVWGMFPKTWQMVTRYEETEV